MSSRERLVSFVITTKNEEKYIEKCLKSIRNQTYKNIEIILVDSYSKDKTVEKATKYADIVIVKDCIMPTGRNIGAKHARGDVLAFVDADVFLDEDWLEKCLPKLQDRPAVAGDLYPENYRRCIKKILLYLFITISKSLTNWLNVDNIGNGSTAYVIKRNIFKSINGYTNKFTTAEDLDFSRRLRGTGYRLGLERSAKAYFSTRHFEKFGYLIRIIYGVKNIIQYYAFKAVVPEWKR